MSFSVIGRRISTLYAKFKSILHITATMTAKHLNRTKRTQSCTSDMELPYWTRKTLNPSSSLFFPGYLVHNNVVPSLLKLICVLENIIVFWEINLCFGKLTCVLGN